MWEAILLECMCTSIGGIAPAMLQIRVQAQLQRFVPLERAPKLLRGCAQQLRQVPTDEGYHLLCCRVAAAGGGILGEERQIAALLQRMTWLS